MSPRPEVPVPETNVPVPGEGDTDQPGLGPDDEPYPRDEDIAPMIVVTGVDSDKVEWSEDMTVDWAKVVTRDNLLALRDFLKLGMDIHVMEEKVRGCVSVYKCLGCFVWV